MNAPTYQCPACAMRYREEATAKKCEAWCTEHHSCNLDIIANAINPQTNSGQVKKDT